MVVRLAVRTRLMTAVFVVALLGSSIVTTATAHGYDVSSQVASAERVATPDAATSTTPAAQQRTVALTGRPIPRTSPGLVPMVSGFGLAAKAGSGRFAGIRRALADERGEFNPGAMLGARGTQTTSTTLGRGRGYRIDIENPAPGARPGQLHLQDEAGGKYLYDFDANEFAGLPRSLAKQIANDPTVARAIAKGRTYLGLE
jgi:hypothetical protein